jgi:uncharacterized membrane protein
MIRYFGLALLSLAILDGLWLGVLMKDFYRRGLAPIARMADGGLDPIWPIAALVYPVLALGLTLFVADRGRESLQALAWGACFGAVTFAVYDLTNHATLREWRPVMTIVDIAWGACSCGISASVASMASRA